MFTTLCLAVLASLPTDLGDSPTLTAALAEVRAERIRADVDFLASDLLAGRDTPSDGLEYAAAYLLNRVQRLRLQPGAKGAWFQEYALRREALDEASRLTLSFLCDEDVELRVLEGYLWTSVLRKAQRGEGPAVAVGDASREVLGELPDGSLRGAWAVASTRPDRLQSTRRRLQRAGVIGLVILPSDGERELELREGSRVRTERHLQGRVRYPRPERDRGDEGDERDDSSPLPIVELLPGPEAERIAATLRGVEPGERLEWTLREDRVARTEVVPARNLCALLPGTGPELRDEVLVCTAHYDHVGVPGGRLHPGADDNASGTAGLLAVAEALARHGPLERSVLLVWLSGEEKGLWGSEAFCDDPPLADGQRVVMNLNLDMIGRTEVGELYITPSRDHERFNVCASLAYDLAPLEGFPELASQDEYFSASDHYNFAEALDVPVVFLSTGDHPDYHQPGDTPDKLDTEKIARVARLAVRLLDGLATLDLGPATDD